MDPFKLMAKLLVTVVWVGVRLPGWQTARVLPQQRAAASANKLYTTSSLRLADATTLINQQLSVRRYGKNFPLRAYKASILAIAKKKMRCSFVIGACRAAAAPSPSNTARRRPKKRPPARCPAPNSSGWCCVRVHGVPDTTIRGRQRQVCSLT